MYAHIHLVTTTTHIFNLYTHKGKDEKHTRKGAKYHTDAKLIRSNCVTSPNIA